jgi:hypothetical protein
MPTEIAHHIALIPGLCVVGVLVSLFLQGREVWPPTPAQWVGLGLFVSWWGDSLARPLGGTLEASYVWIPVQLWMVLFPFMGSAFHRLMLAVSLLILAPISWDLPGPGKGPGADFLLNGFGFLAVLLLARGKLAFPLYIYFGLGTALYFLMMTGPPSSLETSLYHCCRLCAYIAFIGIIAPPLIQKRRAGQ